MKVIELIEKLKLLPPELEVVTEGDECLSLNEPNPHIRYYEPCKGENWPTTPTYPGPTARFLPHNTSVWEERALTPVVIL